MMSSTVTSKRDVIQEFYRNCNSLLVVGGYTDLMLGIRCLILGNIQRKCFGYHLDSPFTGHKKKILMAQEASLIALTNFLQRVSQNTHQGNNFMSDQYKLFKAASKFIQMLNYYILLKLRKIVSMISCLKQIKS